MLLYSGTSHRQTEIMPSDCGVGHWCYVSTSARGNFWHHCLFRNDILSTVIEENLQVCLACSFMTRLLQWNHRVVLGVIWNHRVILAHHLLTQFLSPSFRICELVFEFQQPSVICFHPHIIARSFWKQISFALHILLLSRWTLAIFFFQGNW